MMTTDPGPRRVLGGRALALTALVLGYVAIAYLVVVNMVH